MVEKIDDAKLGKWNGFFEAFQGLLSEAEIAWQQQEADAKERESSVVGRGPKKDQSGNVSTAVDHS